LISFSVGDKRSNIKKIHFFTTSIKVKDIIKTIEQDGWFVVRTKGSHRKYKHHNKKGMVTIVNNFMVLSVIHKGRYQS
jgi:hypothetical protein